MRGASASDRSLIVPFKCRRSQVVFALYVLCLRQDTSRSSGLGLPGPNERSTSLCAACTSDLGHVQSQVSAPPALSFRQCRVSSFCTSCSRAPAKQTPPPATSRMCTAGSADASAISRSRMISCNQTMSRCWVDTEDDAFVFPLVRSASAHAPLANLPQVFCEPRLKNSRCSEPAHLHLLPQVSSLRAPGGSPQSRRGR